MEPGGLCILIAVRGSLRTVFLAVVATATFVGSAILVFDVEWQVMLRFFLASLLGLAIVMLAALGAIALKVLLQRWRS